MTYNRVTAALQSDNPPAAIYMANRRETREYIERVLDTAQPDDWVLLQNEVNLVPEIICCAHEKGQRVVFNPSPVPENLDALPLACVSLFMVNEIEAAQLAGTDANADFEDKMCIRDSCSGRAASHCACSQTCCRRIFSRKTAIKVRKFPLYAHRISNK